jgi:ribonuclease P protein component
LKGTIKSKTDIERLFRKGRRSSSYLMTVLESPCDADVAPLGRCAYIAGKKLGVAPYRSRCKRVLRECSRELGAPWSGHDVVFTARHKLARAQHDEVVRVMSRQLADLGINGNGN